MSAPSPDHYAVLGLSESASSSQVRSAFLRLIREVHPDALRYRDPAGPEAQAGGETAARIIAAYRCLHDPSARARYDRERRATRQALVLVDHRFAPRQGRGRAAIVMRTVVGMLMVACASGAIYVLARDPGVIDQVFAADRPPSAPVDRLREQLRVEARLDVEWIMTVHGPNMLGPLSRQCFAANPEHRSRAQCAYCLAFDEAAANAVPGDAYFGNQARSERQNRCPA